MLQPVVLAGMRVAGTDPAGRGTGRRAIQRSSWAASVHLILQGIEASSAKSCNPGTTPGGGFIGECSVKWVCQGRRSSSRWRWFRRGGAEGVVNQAGGGGGSILDSGCRGQSSLLAASPNKFTCISLTQASISLEDASFGRCSQASKYRLYKS